MTRLAKLQFAGPAAIFATILAADSAAYALDQAPSSTMLWYINIEFFGIFQNSHSLADSLSGVAHSELLFIATPLLVLAIGGALFRLSLLIALASNLSCLYASFLLYVWYANEHLSREASLAAQISRTDFSIPAEVIVCGLMLVPTLLSLCASHIIYLGLLRPSLAGQTARDLHRMSHSSH
jgi:hypothetical protein